jgi:hypothetical protein
MDGSDEIWRALPGHEGNYEVSSHGRVRSLDRIIVTKAGVSKRISGQLMKQHEDEDGYWKTGISSGGKHRKYRVHTLVALTFIGFRPEGTEVCHNDSDRKNNHVSNLRYDTHSANIYDAVDNGTWGPTSKSECPSGHKYSPENTYTLNGSRHCRECNRNRSREWFRKNKSKGKEYWMKTEL